MTEIVRHEPIDIAKYAAEAPSAARNGIVYFKVTDCGPCKAITYEIRADGSASVLNDGYEIVIEDGKIVGCRLPAFS